MRSLAFARPWLSTLAAAAMLAACQGAPATPGPAVTAPPLRGSVVNRLAAEVPQSGKTLLALYLLGSDLEDRGQKHEAGGPVHLKGAGTDDLKELVRGWQALSAEQRAQVDLLVLFGGARQPGWVGHRLADMATLMKDAEDGSFGNLPDAEYLKVGAGSLGEGATWTDFLKAVQARQAGHSKSLVALWNHGASWKGLGPDTNTNAILSLEAIRQGLEGTRFQADLVGFDACLMASLEVAGAVAGHFKWLLASEELEPGHGWNYEALVQFLGQQSSASVPAIAKGIVDAYMETPRHLRTQGKTLSLVDLEALSGNLGPALSQLSQGLNGAQHITPFGAATQVAQRFGVHQNLELSRDLGGLLAELKRQSPELAASIEASLRGLEASVRYAREDGTKPGSQGLSLFSLGQSGDFNVGYVPERAFPKALHQTMQGWFEAASQDQEPPSFSAVAAPGVGFQLAQSATPSAGWKVGDQVCVAEVAEVHALLIEGGFALVGNALPQPLPGQAQSYRQPTWDGRSLVMEAGGTAAPLATTQEQGTDGVAFLSAPILLNAEPATLVLELDGERVARAWVQLYQDNGEPSRDQRELVDGDLVEPLRLAYRTQEDQISVEGGVALKVQGEAQFRLAPQGEGAIAFLLAKDLAGNLNVSEPVEARP